MSELTSYEAEVAAATAAIEAEDIEALNEAAAAFAKLAGQDLAALTAKAAEYKNVETLAAEMQNGESDTLALIALYLGHAATALESYLNS